MADNRILMFVDLDEAVVSLFTHYCLCFDLLNDNDVHIKQNINSFSEKIKDYLIDRYNLDADVEKAYFTDTAPLKDCKNTAESYGEICVKCNKCGRFDI